MTAIRNINATATTARAGRPIRTSSHQFDTAAGTIYFPELKQDIRRLTGAMDAEGQLVMETAFLGGKAGTAGQRGLQTPLTRGAHRTDQPF